MLLDLFIKPTSEKEKNRGDSSLKSISKAISWRVVGTLDTILISYIITGEATVALSIGSIETFTKVILYFIHERLWNRLAPIKARRT